MYLVTGNGGAGKNRGQNKGLAPMFCKYPLTLKTGAVVHCNCCSACKAARTDDWIGRALAEQETSSGVSTVTLTYGADEAGEADHFRAAFLNYPDVQEYLKLLRFHGYPVRYIAAGEYGKTKGRAHWHLVLFWQSDRVPEFRPGELLALPGRAAVPMEGGEAYPLCEGFTERHWRHGFSYWDDGSYKGLRYVLKYLRKDAADEEWQGHFSCSKRPPLGARFFEERARAFVEQGLSPQDGRYSFRDVRKRNGKPRIFEMQRRSLELFMDSFESQWAARWRSHPPASPLLEAWADRKARLRGDPLWQPVRFEKKPRPAPLLPCPRQGPGGAIVSFSEALHVYTCEVEGQRLYWSLDATGEAQWLKVVVPQAEAARRRAVAAGRRSPAKYRAARDPGGTPESGLGRPLRGRRWIR